MKYKADFKAMPARLVPMQSAGYGDKRDFPKIDIFANGRYICSTTWSKTCRQAAAIFRGDNRLKSNYNLNGSEVITANFARVK